MIAKSFSVLQYTSERHTHVRDAAYFHLHIIFSTWQQHDYSRGSRKFCRWNWTANARELSTKLLQSLRVRREMLPDGSGQVPKLPPDPPTRLQVLAVPLARLWNFSKHFYMTCTALRAGNTCEPSPRISWIEDLSIIGIENQEFALENTRFNAAFQNMKSSKNGSEVLKHRNLNKWRTTVAFWTIGTYDRLSTDAQK